MDAMDAMDALVPPATSTLFPHFNQHKQAGFRETQANEPTRPDRSGYRQEGAVMPLVHTGRQQITVDKHGLDADRGKLLKQTVGLTDQYPMRRKRTHLPTNPPFQKGGTEGFLRR